MSESTMEVIAFACLCFAVWAGVSAVYCEAKYHINYTKKMLKRSDLFPPENYDQHYYDDMNNMDSR